MRLGEDGGVLGKARYRRVVVVVDVAQAVGQKLYPETDGEPWAKNMRHQGGACLLRARADCLSDL